MCKDVPGLAACGRTFLGGWRRDDEGSRARRPAWIRWKHWRARCARPTTTTLTSRFVGPMARERHRAGPCRAVARLRGSGAETRRGAAGPRRGRWRPLGWPNRVCKADRSSVAGLLAGRDGAHGNCPRAWPMRLLSNRRKNVKHAARRILRSGPRHEPIDLHRGLPMRSRPLRGRRASRPRQHLLLPHVPEGIRRALHGLRALPGEPCRLVDAAGHVLQLGRRSARLLPGCGTPLTYRNVRGSNLSVTLNSLDDPGFVKPEASFFSNQKAAWLNDLDRLPSLDVDRGSEPA